MELVQIVPIVIQGGALSLNVLIIYWAGWIAFPKILDLYEKIEGKRDTQMAKLTEAFEKLADRIESTHDHEPIATH